MEQYPDLSLSGIGKSNGGRFSFVDISGVGTILDSVEAERITISGKGTIEGSVNVHRKLDINGMGTIHGDVRGAKIDTDGAGIIHGSVEVDEIETAGNLKIEGNVHVNELYNTGRCTIESNLVAEKVESFGFLNVGRDLSAEEFCSQGTFTVHGLLNAHKIEIEIHGYCQAKEIGGEEIRVRSGHSYSLLSKLISPFLGEGKEMNKLTAELIEGTTVVLSHTKANVVRGNKVVVGPECVIREVEYTDSLEIDPNAIVLKQSRA